jgi:hypothetical protein
MAVNAANDGNLGVIFGLDASWISAVEVSIGIFFPQDFSNRAILACGLVGMLQAEVITAKFPQMPERADSRPV